MHTSHSTSPSIACINSRLFFKVRYELEITNSCSLDMQELRLRRDNETAVLVESLEESDLTMEVDMVYRCGSIV